MPANIPDFDHALFPEKYLMKKDNEDIYLIITDTVSDQTEGK